MSLLQWIAIYVAIILSLDKPGTYCTVMMKVERVPSQDRTMHLIRACCIAGVLMLCLSGSLWADSVTQDMVVAEYNVATSDMTQNWKVYESSNVLQSEFNAGEKADFAGLFFAWFGDKADAQAEFKIALADFSSVANGLSPSSAVPDAGSLGLMGCTGLVLLGALKRKFSR